MVLPPIGGKGQILKLMEDKMKESSCHNYFCNDIPDDTSATTNTKSLAKTPGRKKLESWLSKNMKIEMTDGRTLIGIFLCTDQGMNIILGSCSEYLKPDDDGIEDEPRFLGLAMVPGCHIVSIQVDDISPLSSDIL